MDIVLESVIELHALAQDLNQSVTLDKRMLERTLELFTLYRIYEKLTRHFQRYDFIGN